LGIQGSIPPAEAFESPMREIVNLIDYSGLTPTSDDLVQLTKGVRSQSLNWAVDTGSVNHLSVAYDPPVVDLTDGIPFRVLVAHTNTGPADLVVNNLVAAAIHRADGANLKAGDLVAGEVACVVFDGQYFQLINFYGLDATNVQNNTYEIGIPYTVDTGPVNNITAIFAPPITVIVAGDPILVMIANTNTGAVHITVNSLASKEVIIGNGDQLIAGQIAQNMIAMMIYDGTKFQLLNPILAKSTPLGGAIAGRLVYQDPNYHISTVFNVFIEAFRVSYTPVNVGDDIYVSVVGAFNSEEVNTNPIGRSIDGYLAYSTNGGSTWNPPNWPGYDYPTSGSFKANVAIADFVEGSQHINPGIQRVDFNFMISGQLTVPAGPPASVIFKLMFASTHPNSPTTMVHGGTIVEVIEYTPIS
jgi:hypothetical protein